MVMGKQRPIHNAPSGRIEFSRVNQQGLAISLQKGGVDRIPQQPQSWKNLLRPGRLRPYVS
jgi:hypothetical protein